MRRDWFGYNKPGCFKYFRTLIKQDHMVIGHIFGRKHVSSPEEWRITLSGPEEWRITLSGPEEWRITLAVNCPEFEFSKKWRIIRVRKQFRSEEHARRWMKENWDYLLQIYTFYQK